MSEPTIAAGFARALLDLAVTRGADRRRLLECSHIDPVELADQDNRIALRKYLALIRAGKDLCNDPALALHFGEEVSMTDLSIVALVCQACETSADAISEMNRLSRLMVDDDGRGPENRLSIRRAGGEVWLELESDSSVDYPELTESAFARLVSDCARTLGNVSLAKAVHVTHEEPSYRAEYDRIFRAPITFNSDRNAMRIDETLLSVKLAPPNRYVSGILSEHADALLEDLERSRTTKGQVERTLIPILHTGEPTMDLIARKLGFSRQTLYRKLKAEGVSYERVLDELRREMAMHYLNGKKMSVKQVAHLVGYSDPSAFSRAFKRWTGSSPRMNKGLE